MSSVPSTPDLGRYGLSVNESLWLAFHVGLSTDVVGMDGREALREIRARWDQMGLPEGSWSRFEADILGSAHAIGLRQREVQFRAVELLAGGACPVGPLNRILS
jgi:hypothetical protein